ncbi:hypothetical protein [Planococcus lenghuensis]|uniref:Uncharacterized protein n=1 Tax=Planococcus lenghuensis TaxID=2213202 RepID=A0A1Q2L2W4_9BACL|nr:hypothetical protein [Planococcus lenghuensis]AQQ54808.1 hypothetical protein B0X71_18010 [Planococcus lenghuensis]
MRVERAKDPVLLSFFVFIRELNIKDHSAIFKAHSLGFKMHSAIFKAHSLDLNMHSSALNMHSWSFNRHLVLFLLHGVSTRTFNYPASFCLKIAYTDSMPENGIM